MFGFIWLRPFSVVVSETLAKGRKEQLRRLQDFQTFSQPLHNLKRQWTWDIVEPLTEVKCFDRFAVATDILLDIFMLVIELIKVEDSNDKKNKADKKNKNLVTWENTWSNPNSQPVASARLINGSIKPHCERQNLKQGIDNFISIFR